jgi:hypothetical protein
MIRSIVRASLTLFAAIPTAAWAADNLADLMQAGYQVIWEGYASITTCVHGQDRYALGPFVFVCDQYTYEYPYHYGDVAIVARQFVFQGGSHLSSYLCLEDGDEQPCVEGSLFQRQ